MFENGDSLNRKKKNGRLLLFENFKAKSELKKLFLRGFILKAMERA